MNKNIEGLLNSVSKIVNTYEKKSATTGDSINLLSIARIETDEVIICRILAFLLNPKEKHYYNCKFLELFLEEIGEVPISNDENFAVYTEYPTDKNRRIDIVIKSENRFLPIEVKVYAEDQEHQCWDYYNYSKDKHGGTKVFYLTPDGHEPSESSKGDLKPGENLIILSFRIQISNWLAKCEQIVPESNKPLRELIREFRMTVNKFNNVMGDMKMQNEILDEIINTNKEEAALAIESAIKSIDFGQLWDNFIEITVNDNSYAEEGNDEHSITIKLDNGVELDFLDQFSKIIFYNVQNVDNLKIIFNSEYKEDGQPYITSYQNKSLFKYFTGFEKSEINKLQIYKMFTKDVDILKTQMKAFIDLIKSNIEEK